ncbi:MAG: hypothetical protein QM660_09080 [Dysgonomonas sp.]
MIGEVLNPKEYLDATYIKNHLAKFEEKASYLMTKDQYDRFLKNAFQAGRSDGLYISTSDNIDKILIRVDKDISIIEKELAIPIGDWKNKGGIV